jgi:HEPN domain-containing protein
MPGKELENRLIDIKMLLEHGITHMNDISRIGRMLAIHHAHQAVELSLRIKAEEIGSNAYRYPDLVRALKKPRSGFQGILIPFERSLDQLNKTRVLAQHYGEAPEQSTVIKLVSIAREAIIDFWNQQFNVNYDDISLHSLLQDKDIQMTLKEAEKLLNEKKYDESVQQSILAIYKNIWKLGEKFPAPAFQLRGESLNWLEGYGSSDPFRKWDDFLFVVLSLPYASRLKELRQKTGIVFFTTGHMQKLKAYEATAADAYFAFSLVAEYSLWIENMYF